MTTHRDTRDIKTQTDRIERGRIHLSMQFDGGDDGLSIFDKLTIDDADTNAMSWAMRRFINRHNKTVALQHNLVTLGG